MYGEVFVVGDQVVWRKTHPYPIDECGPFFVGMVETNEDPQACICGANSGNGYTHHKTEQCGQLPAQRITLRRVDGTPVLDQSGQVAIFVSYNFQRI